MPFSWLEYLDQARFLETLHREGLNNPGFSEEAAFRSVVSRAYYAVFCHSRNYARDNQNFIPTEKSDDHWKLRRHFRGKDLTSIASNLAELHQWRKNCDYDDVVINLDQLLLNALDNAQEVIDRLT